MTFKPSHLCYFVAVAQEGQVTGAAKKLRVAQPALSQAISRLEEQLGFSLFARSGKGVTLTEAGREFLPKARAVLAAERDVERQADALRRYASDTITVGFIGPPPTMTMPELFGLFGDRHPEAELSLQDLPFPRGRTHAWLDSVDVAICHLPEADRDVGTQMIRTEPRAVMAPASHRLADRVELSLAEVLEETFVSHHPDVQPGWAGFHSLDDHRGGPPPALTVAHAATSLQMLAIMTTHTAITLVPYCDAKIAQQALSGVAAIPLPDADPAILSLVWRADIVHPLVEALVDVARSPLG